MAPILICDRSMWNYVLLYKEFKMIYLDAQNNVSLMREIGTQSVPNEWENLK